jgi:exodeoxyribonuclease-3
MKIASWNVNSLNVRLPHVERWCAETQPDVLALQETKLEDAKFPVAALEAAGYRAAFSGQKTYNGVAILAKAPLRDVVHGIDGYDDPQKRIISATADDPGSSPGQAVRIVNLYVVNGQAIGTEKYAYKLDWLAKVAGFLAEEIRRHPRLVVLGDFNIAPDDRDVHDPVAWHEQVLCSTPEREALKRVLDAGLVDSFRLFNDDGGHYSWWDYRQGAYRRNLGLRIDLILASEALREHCRAAAIDRGPRKWERASDHTPVLLEIADGSR